MTRPQLFFSIFLLQFEAVINNNSNRRIFLYHRVGEDVILPSNVDASSNCSDVHWFYYKDRNARAQDEFCDGHVQKMSPRADRLSLSRNCSLVIKNNTAEDAGQYSCRIGESNNQDIIIYLTILAISPSPPGADQRSDESVTLKCSLLRFDDLGPCEQNSLLWMNETGTELLGEGDWYEFRGQTNCVSVLTVKHQRNRNRRITCKFVQDNRVKIEAEYTLDFIAVINNNSNRRIFLYHRVGEDVILPSNVDASSNCSDVHWFYYKDKNAQAQDEFRDGHVQKMSPRADRLSLSRNCSLVIKNNTAEDAGQYSCRIGESNNQDIIIYLTILAISPSPPGADQRSDESVTLKCSLLRFDDLGPCEQNSLLWMDETGTELLGEGDWYEFRGQTNCVSVLTVKHQRNRNRRITCKFVQDNRVKIEAEYTLDFIAGLFWVAAAVLVPVLLITVVMLIRWKRNKGRKRQTDDNTGLSLNPAALSSGPEASQDMTDPEEAVFYTTISYPNNNGGDQVPGRNPQHDVVYSSVRDQSSSAGASTNPNSLYAIIQKTN